MLRYTLSSQHEELVTLERELETVGDYLALESLRFGERLRVELDIAAGARDVRIPVMLLQTVVENAIKHGIAELPSWRRAAGFRDAAERRPAHRGAESASGEFAVARAAGIRLAQCGGAVAAAVRLARYARTGSFAARISPWRESAFRKPHESIDSNFPVEIAP